MLIGEVDDVAVDVTADVEEEAAVEEADVEEEAASEEADVVVDVLADVPDDVLKDVRTPPFVTGMPVSMLFCSATNALYASSSIKFFRHDFFRRSAAVHNFISQDETASTNHTYESSCITTW